MPTDLPTEIRWCPSCATDATFEQPPCEDGHGPDCLDLACTECGLGLVRQSEAVGRRARTAARAA